MLFYTQNQQRFFFLCRYGVKTAQLEIIATAAAMRRRKGRIDRFDGGWERRSVNGPECQPAAVKAPWLLISLYLYHHWFALVLIVPLTRWLKKVSSDFNMLLSGWEEKPCHVFVFYVQLWLYVCIPVCICELACASFHLFGDCATACVLGIHFCVCACTQRHESSLPIMYIGFLFCSLYLSAPIWQTHINRWSIEETESWTRWEGGL